jgi:hypothetical protein
VEVKATRTTEVEGDADDDSNDIGKMFPLNLAIPTPGNYKIRMEYLEDASVFRSNTSVTGFPFSIDNAISLTGALYDGDTVTNSYYYLYDIKVKSVGCPSKRIAVKAVKGNQIEPVIEAIGSTTVCDTPVKLQFSGDINLSFQWKKDGADIPGATASTYTATESGVYTLIVANSECTSAASNAITLNIIKLAKPSVSQNDGTLTSSSSVGNQWYFNGEPITGANGKSYKATTSGYYRVKVFDQACSIDSDSIEVYLTPPVENGAWLYPNPTADLVNVKYRAKEDPSSVIVNVYNVLGVKIINGQLTREFRDIYSGKVSTSHLPAGVYVVKVEAEGKSWTERLIKD